MIPLQKRKQVRLFFSKKKKKNEFNPKKTYKLYGTCKHFKRNMKLNSLIWVEGNFTHHWFCLNNSEKVKALTLAFCSIQKSFIKGIHYKFGVPNLPQSPDINQTSNGSISDSQISGQSLLNKNCHNSRTSNDTDIKLGPYYHI